MNTTPDPVLQAAIRSHLLSQVAAEPTRSRALPAAGSERARPWLRVSVTVLIVAATAVASLYAIQLGQQGRQQVQPANSGTATPSVRPTESRFRGQITTATGRLTGAASGTVSLSSRPDGGFTIRINTTRLDGLQVRHVELATSLADIDCTLENNTSRARAADFGGIDLSKPTTLERPPYDGNDFGDLSFMSVLVLTPNNGADNNDYCTPSKMGIAKLRWTRPAAYLALQAVDHGSAAAARGRVTLRDGQPESYTVAPDDQLRSVAARFGFTAEELLYLNPRRQRDADPTLYYDETLNLDTTNR